MITNNDLFDLMDLLLEGDNSRALTLAFKIDPGVLTQEEFLNFLVLKSEILYRVGRREECFNCLKTALAIDPSFTHAKDFINKFSKHEQSRFRAKWRKV